MPRKNTFIEIDIAAIATTTATRAADAGYAAPVLHEVGTAVELVQGGGGASGGDCRYYYYRSPGPYGC